MRTLELSQGRSFRPLRLEMNTQRFHIMLRSQIDQGNPHCCIRIILKMVISVAQWALADVTLVRTHAQVVLIIVVVDLDYLDLGFQALGLCILPMDCSRSWFSIIRECSSIVVLSWRISSPSALKLPLNGLVASRMAPYTSVELFLILSLCSRTSLPNSSTNASILANVSSRSLSRRWM